MHFKKGIFSAVAVAIVLSACAGGKEKEAPTTDHSEDNIIGQNLSSISSLNGESGSDQAKIAMYDSTVCRIQQFDMATGKWERALKPRYMGGNHKVMFEPAGNYVIDAVDGHISVFNKFGTETDPGVQFAGAPKTASFRPSLGYFVIQDDSKTVALVKISPDGNVSATNTKGQVVTGNTTMMAGDIDDQGNLILALSDGSLAVVDIAQNLATPNWVLKYSFATGLSNINWIAPMHDGSNQVLVKTNADLNGDTRIAIFDTVTKAQVGSTYVVPKTRLVIKTSKLYDPHFIVRDNVSADDHAISTILYASGGAIQHVDISTQIRNVLSSRISISGNSWTMVDTDVWLVWDGWHWYHRIAYDDYNIVQQNRWLWRFSLGMALLKKYRVPDTSQLQIAENKIFQLFPVNLGKAVLTNFMDATSTPIEKFNYQFLHKEPCQ